MRKLTKLILFVALFLCACAAGTKQTLYPSNKLVPSVVQFLPEADLIAYKWDPEAKLFRVRVSIADRYQSISYVYERASHSQEFLAVTCDDVCTSKVYANVVTLGSQGIQPIDTKKAIDSSTVVGVLSETPGSTCRSPNLYMNLQRDMAGQMVWSAWFVCSGFPNTYYYIDAETGAILKTE